MLNEIAWNSFPGVLPIGEDSELREEGGLDNRMHAFGDKTQSADRLSVFIKKFEYL